MTVFKRLPNLRLKDLLLLAAITSVTVLVVVLLMLQAEKNIAKANIRHAAQRAAEEFQRIIGNVEGVLLSARIYGVNPTDVDGAAHYFKSSVFPRIKKLFGIALAEQGGKAFYFQWDAAQSNIFVEGEDNPSSAVWFEKALEHAGTNYWTGIHPLRNGEPGISVSLSWPAGDVHSVVAAYDILLDEFFTVVQGLAPTPASQAFIFLPDGTPYVPDNEELARRGLDHWQSGLKNDDGSGVSVATSRIGGETWWCGFVPLAKARRAVWMCVMVPKSDLVEDVVERRLIYAGVGLMVLAAIVVIYLIFSRRQPTPLFVQEPNPEQILALIEQGENQEVEFKSTMRMNLHSKKPGKEIEQAWLKGVAAFLNTNGGTLLLGITDAGEITGLEQDVFENDDKCRLHFKNLIAKGLGADVSKYIRFSLVPVEGQTVGVVQCVKSPRPVYLRDGNKEAFYIRNGPSSDELPASRMVEYIAENWK